MSFLIELFISGRFLIEVMKDKKLQQSEQKEENKKQNKKRKKMKKKKFNSSDRLF